MGENDLQIGETSLAHLTNLPNHTVTKLAGAGHACYMNKPREFHEHLVAFLGGLASGWSWKWRCFYM